MTHFIIGFLQPLSTISLHTLIKLLEPSSTLFNPNLISMAHQFPSSNSITASISLLL